MNFSKNFYRQALQFTFEKEENNSLPFLDVLVEMSGAGFLTSVYHKPTFSGLYTQLPLKENSLLDLVGLETLLKQVILPLVNIF